MRVHDMAASAADPDLDFRVLPQANTEADELWAVKNCKPAYDEREPECPGVANRGRC